MNYTELKQQVKDFLEVDETTFNTNIDYFIKLAEEDIYRKVQALSTRMTATSSCTASNRFLAPPSDFLSVYAISVKSGTTYTSLLRKDVSYMREAFPTSTTTGLPKYWAMWDNDSILLGPTPDSGYEVELHYLGKPTSIVSASTTWIGDYAENALLYGTLLQAYTFLKGSPDVMAVYKTAYDQAINNLQVLVDGMQKKDEYRHGSRRIPT